MKIIFILIWISFYLNLILSFIIRIWIQYKYQIIKINRLLRNWIIQNNRINELRIKLFIRKIFNKSYGY